MRPLPSIIVLDATVVIAAALGRSAFVIERAHKLATLVTTDRAIKEAQRRIELGLKAPEFLPQLAAIADSVAVVPLAELVPRLPNAATVLRDAVASRNGSIRDAHILVLAWASGGDIWSADRDFAGTGVATWSTLNLVRALAQAEA